MDSLDLIIPDVENNHIPTNGAKLCPGLVNNAFIPKYTALKDTF